MADERSADRTGDTTGAMQHRTLGRTGRTVSVVGLGTWQLGADWGDVSEADARAVLDASVEEGVTFFDTADVYGDGRSESIIGRFLADHPDAGVTVATKMGRREAQVPENYVLDNFRAWTERSRRNLGVDTLDLVQLHCPPTAVYSDDELYDALDTLVQEGAVSAYGVSVEKVEEALAAIARPHVATVQIIANAFRLKPLDEVFPAAAEAGVGLVIRVPLASGLLSGKYDESTTFADDDHRSYNRDGSAFDVGETFSGVDFETGLVAAKEFGDLVRNRAPEGTTSAQAAIAWLWQHQAVSSVIPGARNVEQARSNAAAGRVAPLGPAFDEGVRRIYDTHLRAAIHPRW
jgi:aryl-alcohol dehydrogenase-like predicted oxidoreductase